MFEWGDLDIPTPPHSEIGAISECYVGNVHDVMFLFLLCVLFDFIFGCVNHYYYYYYCDLLS